jgi:hypothetical protein
VTDVSAVVGQKYRIDPGPPNEDSSGTYSPKGEMVVMLVQNDDGTYSPYTGSGGGGGGGGNAAASATGAAVPADAGYTGFSNTAGSLVGISPTNPLPTTLQGVSSAAPLPVSQGPVTPTAGSISVVSNAGTAVAAAVGPWKGGIVQNPPSGSGTLYINLVSTAGTVAGGTTFALSAGDSRDLPPVSSGVTLSVNASSSSYTFCLEIDT